MTVPKGLTLSFYLKNCIGTVCSQIQQQNGIWHSNYNLLQLLLLYSTHDLHSTPIKSASWAIHWSEKHWNCFVSDRHHWELLPPLPLVQNQKTRRNWLQNSPRRSLQHCDLPSLSVWNHRVLRICSHLSDILLAQLCLWYCFLFGWEELCH